MVNLEHLIKKIPQQGCFGAETGVTSTNPCTNWENMQTSYRTSNLLTVKANVSITLATMCGPLSDHSNHFDNKTA